MSPSRRALVVPALAGIIASATSQQSSLPRTPEAVIQAAEQAVTAKRGSSGPKS